MLAPIVTKEMKLFPSHPLPPRIKNVRSRAQSLQDFANGNAIHVTTTSTASSTNTHLLNTTAGARTHAARSKNSQSIGSLPTNTVLAASFQTTQMNSAVMIIPTAKTPPKYSTSSASLRKPLDSIVEGVELKAQSSSSVGQNVLAKDTTTAAAAPTSKLQQTNKNPLLPLKSKNAARGKASTTPKEHRSSQDDLAAVQSYSGSKKDGGNTSKRTHSAETERKKRNERKCRSGSSAAGCFTMWLNSKFRKGGGVAASLDDESSSNSGGGGGEKEGNNEKTAKTTPEPATEKRAEAAAAVGSVNK